MNTVIVDANVVAAAPSLARPPVLETSICRRGALLRSALSFRTRISDDGQCTRRRSRVAAAVRIVLTAAATLR